jgi:erythromycin esterase-like protein
MKDRFARLGAAAAPGPLDGARPLPGDADDYDELVERAAGARYVLLGEASHGTEDFYRERARITARLIAEAGFTAIAVEGDWPDAYRVNRWLRGASDDASAREALGDFRRFPAWMWRNTVVEELVARLREWNAGHGANVGFYGLDLYSPRASMEAVIAYLQDADPSAAARARERYACFDHFGRDPRVYAREAGLSGAESCEPQVVEQLVELRRAAADDGNELGEDARFVAEQNARLVVNAERYYRAMFRGGAESWNLRDRHMAETLFELTAHLERTTGTAKTIVWAHNSHLGDARATDIVESGELSLGQLVRERRGARALNVGFTTYAGTVTAASDWGGVAERKRVRRALPDSWEELFHATGHPRLLIDPTRLGGRRLQRAIGVVYRPQTELLSHYLHARIAEQFDAVVHIDETQALEPLEVTSEWEAGEVPETFPSGV